MPLKEYGVLKGNAIHKVLGSGRNPHYQIHMIDARPTTASRSTCKSQETPSEVEYLVDDAFAAPDPRRVAALDPGWHRLASRPDERALDYIRGNLFDRTAMRPLPFNVPGPDNDLNEQVDRYVARAIADEDATLYAFGERWGPEADVKDKYLRLPAGQRRPRHPHEPGQRRPASSATTASGRTADC